MDVTGSYEQDGYALVRGLIAPEVAKALLERVQLEVEARGRTLQSFAQGNPLLRKAAVEISGHFHPPLLTFLWGLTPIVSQLTGRDLLPSYDYFRIYQQGDICRVHADRPSCEHSMSLTLGYSDGRPWSLDLGARPANAPEPLGDDFGGEAFASLAMQPGDAVLYRGVRLRHGRITPNPNRWSAHLFLHWVDRHGPHADHAFDAKRIAEETARMRPNA
jgi:hypothetical protein